MFFYSRVIGCCGNRSRGKREREKEKSSNNAVSDSSGLRVLIISPLIYFMAKRNKSVQSTEKYIQLDARAHARWTFFSASHPPTALSTRAELEEMKKLNGFPLSYRTAVLRYKSQQRLNLVADKEQRSTYRRFFVLLFVMRISRFMAHNPKYFFEQPKTLGRKFSKS